jgi:hypothetical protein
MKQVPVFVRHSRVGRNPEETKRLSPRLSLAPRDELDPVIFGLSGPGNSKTTENGVHMFHI